MLLAVIALSSAEPLPWGERIRAYEHCVKSKALAFEKANEGIDATIDAAFDACKIERAGIELLVRKVQQGSSRLSPSQKQTAVDLTMAEIDRPIREELTVTLFEKRSGK